MQFVGVNLGNCPYEGESAASTRACVPDLEISKSASKLVICCALWPPANMICLPLEVEGF